MTDPGAKSFYITTAIDYPNGAPHIGHSMEKVAADVMARFHRLLGDDVAFTMGLDENSQHIVTAAKTAGIETGPFTDEMDRVFRASWDALQISRSSWVRTTEPRHTVASQELFSRALANGDIYKSTYAGWYCPNCNNYYTEDELVDGRCPNHPSITPEWLEEENYFFALSKYSDFLRDHIAANPEFITPSTWTAEVMGLIESGLRDFSVSRRVKPDTEPWGVPVPGDPEHVLYVWFDALTTYLTGIGFPEDGGTSGRYWPADSQVIGKDILRFHTLYWPAMLASAGLPLPRRIAIHGFMTLEGRRISKTTGNVISPIEVVDEFGADPVRYYLMRDLSFSSDGDFSRSKLIRRYNDDLGNDLGNLLNRVVAMIGRYRGGVVPAASDGEAIEAELREIAANAHERAAHHIDQWQLNEALEEIWQLVRRANQYLEARKPWTLAKNEADAGLLDTTLYTAAEATRLAGLYLAPFIPGSADKIMAQLGLDPIADGDWTSKGTWGSADFGTVDPAGPLFPRIEVTE
ncbi:MAG: methionine--tRNA ligase [Thermomicrobiales bacterium]|nr:methionine--tRNA ligase [Thermomicrobiales bacterium]